MSRLPVKLLVAILHLALPRMGLIARGAYYHSRFYMRILYFMRAVSKRWQDIIDGTPSFWTTLPAHVNDASILRSSPLPLCIVYHHTSKPGKFPSAKMFLGIIAPTRPRWSTLALYLDGPATLSGYFEAPTPILQTIIVRRASQSHVYQPKRRALGVPWRT
ncbi:hypothetical protein M407DRAFT_26433 [Tulasnella calospora MUT 4182]|uniref:Uncharacterized protein n=1 Tax=Tulasnella calospora MUT 4182 TaxID=1051891 RepID=A0A0C3QFQ4_9AGAM|nr:hypothetical protein M407DRAFT_26433 [Tulasnella calospora MUT 4182]